MRSSLVAAGFAEKYSLLWARLLSLSRAGDRGLYTGVCRFMQECVRGCGWEEGGGGRESSGLARGSRLTPVTRATQSESIAGPIGQHAAAPRNGPGAGRLRAWGGLGSYREETPWLGSGR